MKNNKIVPFLVAIFVSTTALAADDLIYIDQVGSSSDITVTQTGTGNTVGGTNGAAASNNKASLTGSDQTISITQTGDDNTLKLKTQDGSTGTSTTNYSAIGNSNTSVKFTGYGLTFSGNAVTNYNMDIDSGNVRILVSPIANANITHFVASQVTYNGVV
jgi:hypothetical protein